MPAISPIGYCMACVFRQSFLDKLATAVVPGATLVLTQLPASGQTTGVDMTVVTADTEAGPG